VVNEAFVGAETEVVGEVLLKLLKGILSGWVEGADSNPYTYIV